MARETFLMIHSLDMGRKKLTINCFKSHACQSQIEFRLSPLLYRKSMRRQQGNCLKRNGNQYFLTTIIYEKKGNLFPTKLVFKTNIDIAAVETRIFVYSY